MANLSESSVFEAGIYQLETTDPVQGGPTGISNTQAKQLANRTKYLKDQIESHAGAVDPHPQYMTTAESNSAISAAIAALVNSSPAALDTLSELATALGNDANFAATLTAALALKAPLASPAFAGNPTAPTQASGDNSTKLATTAFVQSTQASHMVLQEQYASGNPAPASVATAMPTGKTRSLNTVVSNSIVGASLTSNQITLPAGTYFIEASAPSCANTHRVFLYNVTDASIAALGTTENVFLNATYNPTLGLDIAWTRSVLSQIMTIASPKILELRHYTSEARANGLGASDGTGANEIYAQMTIKKVG